jgi:hypothetical protein
MNPAPIQTRGWHARADGGHEARLAYNGNVLIENRNGLVVDTELLQCNGTAERDAALLMAERLTGEGRVTIGADKGYDTREFVRELRDMNITPQVAQNENRSAAARSMAGRRGTRVTKSARCGASELLGAVLVARAPLSKFQRAEISTYPYSRNVRPVPGLILTHST